MSKKIKVGVAGCGYWGPNLIRNFRSLPDCQLKTMCDLNTTRLKHLKSLYPEVAGETDYSRMLNGVNLDAVVIATGVGSHYPMAKASLLAGFILSAAQQSAHLAAAHGGAFAEAAAAI